ncbi:hypothetical protein JCM33374_g4266 [Metschnikowia sp. JCM 33374]|nr:hypothetical protein JCM33374_g4266 [Metschnikowia sp. JCM 33374]
MTEIPPSLEKATPLSVFLNSVCPGLPVLDGNTHFSLENSLTSSQLHAIETFNWPVTGSNVSVSAKAHLDHTYLHVARPPFEPDVHKNIESTTYVPMPLHYASLFSKLITEGTGQNQDGGKHIGANVNPLLHDPFCLVHLNPGCLSSMITLHSHPKVSGQGVTDFRNPFNKMTHSINRLLRIGVSDSSHASHWHPLLSEIDTDGHNSSHKSSSKKSMRDTPIINSLIDFDKKFYSSHISSSSTSKLLVSASVNVVNVFAIGENHKYSCTSTFQSTAPIFPQPPTPVVSSTHSSGASSSSVHSSSVPYKKVIERPILRLQLNTHLLVTSLLTLSNEMLIVIGLSNGDIFLINLASLTFRHLDDLGNHDYKSSASNLSSVNAVTSLCAVAHPTHDLLIIAGYATGEVVILDPNGGPKTSDGMYTKTVVGSDRFVTYFKIFDLSGWCKRDAALADETSPAYLIGHFKISHKPITSIASTMPHESSVNNPHKPMIIAFASEDGLVRFVDLTATYGKNYGNSDNFYNSPILTDIVSNYFQDGVRDIGFSPDNKFFVSCGKGDLVEIFKMSYYNVNALLHKNGGAPSNRGGRSRSGTINSSNSSNIQSSASFLGYGSTPASLDVPKVESSETYYAPAIKDIAIVSRLKGHMNTVQKVSFLSKDQYFSPGDISTSGTYNLITCGNDGKVNLWEFNNKALPRIKKCHFTTVTRRPSHHGDSASTPQLQSLSSRRKSLSSPSLTRTQKSARPFNSEDLQLTTSFSKLGINNLLSSNSQTMTSPENTEEQLQIVFSLYRSLYEMRLKKHYAKQKKELRAKYSCVVHGIVNDKDLPSIQVPLLEMDLSCLVKNGHISGYHCDSKDFWIYGKSGDIFRYEITI